MVPKDHRVKRDMVIKAPRPTRLSHFVWKPKSNTLRITVNPGSRRIVEWVGLRASNGLKLSEEQNNGPLDSEAQQPISVNKEGVAGPLDTKTSLVRQFCVGEASGTKEITTESMHCDSNDEDDDFDSENPAAPSLVVSDGVFNEVDSGEDNSCREPGDKTIIPMVGVEDKRLTVSEVETSPVMMSDAEETPLQIILFSPDNEHISTETSMSEDGVTSLPASFILEEPWNSDYLSGSCILGDFGNYATRDTQSPLSCTPLDRIDPLDFTAFTQEYTGDILALEEAMSVWVEQRYKGFKKLVGMDLLGFEDECICLLHRIDTERKRMRSTAGPRYTKGSVTKGKRELRNLISLVNYEGRKEAKASC